MKYKADWDFATEVKFMGYNRHGYKGAFPDKVEEDIIRLIKSPKALPKVKKIKRQKKKVVTTLLMKKPRLFI